MLNDMSSESIARILPIFLHEVMLANFLAIGWVEGLAESLSIVLRYTSGWLTDAIKKKKGLIAIGYSISAITRPFYPFIIPVFGWMGAMVLKALDRVGKAVRMAPRDAFIAQDSYDGHRAEAFGLNRTLDTLGGLLGMVFVALILLLYGNGNFLSPSLFKMMVFGASLFGFIGVGFVLFGLKENFLKKETKNEKSFKANGSLKDLPSLFYLYLISFSVFSLAGSSDAFLILKLKSSGFSLISILGLIIAYNLLATLVAYPISRLSDKKNNRKIPLMLGWVIYSLTYFVFGWTFHTSYLACAFVMYGLYYGFVESIEKTIVADLVPKTHLGRAYGLFNVMNGLIILPANLIFGWVADRWNIETGFLFSSMVALVATGVLAVVTMVHQRRQSVDFTHG